MGHSRKFEKRAEYEIGSWQVNLSVRGGTPEEMARAKHLLLQDIKNALREMEAT